MPEQLDLVADPQWWQSYISSTVQDSPLYSEFYAHLPYDQELRPLLALIDQSQPVPTLFFSTVNFLLLRSVEHPLAEFYPYLCAAPRPAREVYPFFHEFCLAHEEELRQILPGARLQTNEVTRCANLLPAFARIFQRGGQQPLALLEIGASAGLNLSWDRYGYDYGQAQCGDRHSPVQVVCGVDGEYPPPLPATLPTVGSRQGIDLAPLDIADEEHVYWLRACIWPEEVARYALLDAAIDLARRNPPKIVQGDACVLLPELLAAIPPEQTVCLWHSFVLRQCPPEVGARIEELLCHFARQRTLYRVSLEYMQPDRRYPPQLELLTYEKGEMLQRELLATCAVHGERMQWLASLPE